MSADGTSENSQASKRLGAGRAAVMLYPSPQVARGLAVPGGLSPEDLHITVQYLGSVDTLPDKQEILDLLRGIAPSGSVPLGLSTPHTFPAGKSGMPVVVHVSGQGPLDNMRIDMRNLGLRDASEHPFNPHMTLGYAKSWDDADQLLAAARRKFLVEKPVNFPTCCLGWSGEQHPVNRSSVTRLSMLLQESSWVSGD